MEKFIVLIAVCGILAGVAVLLVGYISLVVSAFGRHAMWGLSLIFVWPLSIVFSVKHWEQANYGAKLCLKGFAIILICGLVFSYIVPSKRANKEHEVSFSTDIYASKLLKNT